MSLFIFRRMQYGFAVLFGHIQLAAIYMSRSHRDGGRKSNLFLSGISCRCYEAKYFPALNDH